MACLQPNDAVQVVNEDTGEISITFKMALPGNLRALKVLKLPCGECLACRLSRSKDWATRCMHEGSMYDENCVITLTYSDDCLPSKGSLCLVDFQRFLKRLRSYFSPRVIRFFHCGEYGDKLGRPHYHCILFNLDFPDKIKWREEHGRVYFRSVILETLWTKGISEIGEFSWESAAYVARYVTKKVYGADSRVHYGDRRPEYITMSRRPGIGHAWYSKYKGDVFPSDSVIVRKVPNTPPRYYDKQLEKVDPNLLSNLKEKRVDRAVSRVGEETFSRRKARLAVLKARAKLLKRSFEHGDS